MLFSSRYMYYKVQFYLDSGISRFPFFLFAGTDIPLTLDSGVGGIILPPVPLYKIPRVVSFSVCPLPSHLVPHLKLGHAKVYLTSAFSR